MGRVELIDKANKRSLLVERIVSPSTLATYHETMINTMSEIINV